MLKKHLPRGKGVGLCLQGVINQTKKGKAMIENDDIFGGEVDTPVVEETVEEVVKPTRKARATKAATPAPVVEVAEAKDVPVFNETLDKLRARFAGMCIVNYDAARGVFLFEGGAQGRVTTTQEQPFEAIANVGREYCNISQGANTMRAALGNYGGGA